MNKEGLEIKEMFEYLNGIIEEGTMFDFVNVMIDHYKYKLKYLKTKRKDIGEELYETLKSVLVEMLNRFIKIRLSEGLKAIGNEPAKNHMEKLK